MREHVKILAWLHIILGGLTLLLALGAFLLFGGVAAAAVASGGHNAGPLALISGFFGTFIFIVIGVLAVPQLILGWGLLNGASWARVLGIVMSILVLIHPAVGLGTALGIYGLVVLLDQDTCAMFESRQMRSY